MRALERSTASHRQRGRPPPRRRRASSSSSLQVRVCLYVTAVAIGCMSWQLWGCFCHDPAHGHPNEWNIVHTAFGPYVHTCQIGVAALLGIPWCAAVGAAVAVNLYVTAAGAALRRIAVQQADGAAVPGARAARRRRAGGGAPMGRRRPRHPAGLRAERRAARRRPRRRARRPRSLLGDGLPRLPKERRARRARASAPRSPRRLRRLRTIAAFRLHLVLADAVAMAARVAAAFGAARARLSARNFSARNSSSIF